MLLLRTTVFLVVLLPLCEGEIADLTCDVILNGCGSFESSEGTQNECCVCRECLSVDCLIPVDVHCFTLQDDANQPVCCPCEEPASLSGSSSSSSSSSASSPTLEECADPKDLRRIKRLIGKAEGISQRTIERCGKPVTDECAGERVLGILQCIYDEIHETIESIKADCGRNH